MTDFPRKRELSQWMTPLWAAEELVERYFPDLGAGDLVLEPSCGTGSFLSAIPREVRAIGVEIDPELAAIARRTTGRQVIDGDFRMVNLPTGITAVVGNPPFVTRTVGEFVERAWHLLPEGGRVGMILPLFCLQTPATVERMSEHWRLEQHLLPRNLFGRLPHPLCFAQLTKDRARTLVGFALYGETCAVQRLRKRYKELLASGERSTWAAVTRAALEHLGGQATLDDLYREIEGHRPTSNAFWKPKIRQQVQRMARRVGAGEWRLITEARIAA